jgi:hypothetical protein
LKTNIVVVVVLCKREKVRDKRKKINEGKMREGGVR